MTEEIGDKTVTGEIMDKPDMDFYYLLVIRENNVWSAGHENLYDNLQELVKRVEYLKTKKTNIGKILTSYEWRIVKIPLPVKIKEK